MGSFNIYRMMSYYARPDNQLENSLWTYKYKPKKATEVCGNDESVKFLSDWLHMWHERGFQISKVRTDGDQCDMQDDDYRCSDSEDIDEEPGLKNVLLVTGPVGCGKSAAIYACAQEQGFEILEDSLEPSLDPSEGSDGFSWCDEQIQMTSAIAQHGFCFYAKDIAAVGSKMGCESSVDIASEMLGSTTHTMALGKLIGQEMRTSSTLFGARSSEMSPPKSDLSRSEINSSLFDIIQSMIPARSYLMVRDVALYEYISSLCHISRSETSRLSGGTHMTKRRRGRAARHYLSTGSLMLSPEDVLLLDQYNLYGSFSSQLVDASSR